MKHLFDMAVRAAKPERGDKRQYALGCVAIRADGVWVLGTNGSDSAPAPSAHAETRALKKAGLDSTLIVARIKKTGELGLAFPCPTCRAMIKNRRVKRVYFSTPEGFSYYDP